MIEFDVIITNGYVSKETISNKCNEGWNFVITLPAKAIHLNALETDKATIFSKYVKPILDDVKAKEECPCMREPSYNCGMKCSRCGREL